MPRSRSARVELVKRQLMERLSDEYQYVGGKFPSARALAARHGISYQTADRLLRELVAEGHLERRAGSGTFVVSRVVPRPERARLLFPDRSRRAGSFGGELLERMRDWLTRNSVPHEVRWSDGASGFSARDFAVCWEAPRGFLEGEAKAGRFALVLNDRPEPGTQATWVDAVTVDDFSGGVCAAELLGVNSKSARVAVLGGPKEDPRSRRRIEGFLSKVPGAKVYHAGTWYAERAQRAATGIVDAGLATVFCCNDRLAQAVLLACRRRGVTPPRIVGFDDAPIARELGLSTVALPWDDLVQMAGERIERRLSGYAGHAAQIILAPRPVRRG